MTQIIDRRLNGRKRSTVNRERFLQRFKQQIRRAVADAVAEGSITSPGAGERIGIPTRDTREPRFRFNADGRREQVHPGNREFSAGDRLRRPRGGRAKGKPEPSDLTGGEDEFMFELSREELLECFFEDLELPNLARTESNVVLATRSVRAGYTRDGVPANINLKRSLRGAHARRIAMAGGAKGRMAVYADEIERLRAEQAAGRLTLEDLDSLVIALEDRSARAAAHLRTIPYLDTFDLRFNHRTVVTEPATQAVMFCLMDVSGSMDEERKGMAKQFFLLLYLFLTRTYRDVDVVFIRHHVTAKEVDEHDFFHARETGGTVVSSALKLMRKIMAERYPAAEWNIYAAQASDGENWGDDSTQCRDLLENEILPETRFFAYVEVTPDYHQTLWEAYEALDQTHENFAMQELRSSRDIHRAFRRLLARKSEAATSGALRTKT